ncbi:MAG: hypothetical protein ACU0CA_03940 [Paracoccaceae bacterium]
MKTRQPTRINRRAALGVIAAAPLATLPSNTKPNDPILQLFEQWWEWGHVLSGGIANE